MPIKTLSRLKTPWKLFIDVEQWDKNDPLVFDKDQSAGYFRNASLGLLCLIQATEMSGDDLDFIIALRNLVFHDKSSRGLTDEVSSGISKESVTESGLRELLKKLSTEKWLHLASSYTEAYSMPILLHGNKNEATIKKDVDYILQEVEKEIQYIGLLRQTTIPEVVEHCVEYSKQYRAAIAAAKNTAEKITSIVTYIQNMHQYHPFADGNGRTFVFFLLNKLLMDNEFSPSIVNNPGNFTAWSVQELVDEIKEGQIRFESLCDADEAEDEKCTRLLTAIRESIQLTPEEEKTIFLQKTVLDNYAQQFDQALRNNDTKKEVEILDNIPNFQRIDFIKNQILKNDYQDPELERLENILYNFRELQYYGFDLNVNLRHLMLENLQRIYKVNSLLDILLYSHHKNENDWCDLVVDMALSNEENDLNKLQKALETADKIKDKAWYDQTLYLQALRDNDYVAFENIDFFIDSTVLEARNEIVKKYIYTSPNIASDFMAVICQENTDGKYPHRTDKVIEEWCELILKNPGLSTSLKSTYLHYGKILQDNPELKEICFSQPQEAFQLASTYQINFTSFFKPVDGDHLIKPLLLSQNLQKRNK